MLKAHILEDSPVAVSWYIWSHEYSTEQKQKVFKEMVIELRKWKQLEGVQSQAVSGRAVNMLTVGNAGAGRGKEDSFKDVS